MPINKLFFIVMLFSPIFFFSCDSKSEVEKIIDKMIENAGGDKYDRVDIEFDFRDIHYRALRNNGRFSYERFINDSLGQIHDVLTNDTFYRELNGEMIEVIDTMAAKYQRSVNGVWYFALLPRPLNDRAVNKELIGETEINGKAYYEIRVTFDQHGGGEDYNDVFIYWVNKETYHFDYMAYVYHTDGGGTRFRAPKDVQVVEEIRFVDWYNYEPKEGYEDTPLHEYEKLYMEDKLKILSEIELRNIGVKILQE